MEALASLLKPEIEKLLKKRSSDMMKAELPLKLDIMTSREIIEYYLKVIKNE